MRENKLNVVLSADWGRASSGRRKNKTNKNDITDKIRCKKITKALG